MLGRAVLLLSLASSPAFAGASFDCQKATTQIEKNICAQNIATQDISAYLRLLPVEAFDNTTDGLTEEEKSALLANGKSENWVLRRASAMQAFVTATHPLSIVTLNLRPFDGGVLEAHTQNEKVSLYSYWKLSSDGKGLANHTPTLLTRAINEAETGSDGSDAQQPFRKLDPAMVPQAVKTYVQSVGNCQDSTRIKNRTRLGCKDLTTREKALRATLAKNNDALAVLNRLRELTTGR